MAAPTVAVTVNLAALGTAVVEGLTVRCKLDQNDAYGGETILAGTQTALTDVGGVAVFNLFPNDPTTGLGTTGSTYRFVIRSGGARIVDVTVQVPNQACNLSDLPNLAGSPAGDPWIPSLNAYLTGRPTATQTSADEVLGMQGGLAKLFGASPSFSQLSAPTGATLVSTIAAGTGAVARTVQDKGMDFVDARDYGASVGGDVGAAINIALGLGHRKIRAYGAYSLSNQILLTSLTGVELDLSNATITASSALNVSLLRLINSIGCVVRLGILDGFASGQTSSSFGIDLNGGSYNRVIGGRITNCKTYGAYIIGCDYASIEGMTSDNNQQAGIAGDVGGFDTTGVRIRNVVVHSNGLGGVGTLNGLYFEGNSVTGFYYKELNIDGVIAFNNRGSGVAGQNWRGYTLSNVNAFNNYRQGVTLAAVLYGTGGNFSLDNNDVGADAGYTNAFAIDDGGVTPASQYNTFTNIASRNHTGYAVIERGTANNNSFLGIDSISDGAVVALTGANSVALSRAAWSGALTFSGKLTGNGAGSGVGYSTGGGGTVVQATNKTTGVTLNAPAGRITMNGAALAGGATASFVLTNSAINSADLMIFNVVSGASLGAYRIDHRPAEGSTTIDVTNITAGPLSESIVIAFAVIKGAVA